MWWFRTRSLGTGEWHKDGNYVQTFRESSSSSSPPSLKTVKKVLVSQETSETLPSSSSSSHHRDTSPPPLTDEEEDLLLSSLSDFDNYNDNDNNNNYDSLFALFLGGEKNLLDPTDEWQGVLQIIKALSDEEKKQVPDTRMYIRHLRAEKGDVNKAIGTLRAALQWRQEFGVHDLLAALPPTSSNNNDDDDSAADETQTTLKQNDLAEMLRFENSAGKVYVRGFDRQGRALIYMRPARENSNNEQNQMRHLVWNIEKAIAVTAKKSKELTGVALEKYNLVIDYDGFKLKNAPPLSTSKYTLDILQKHYPERMYRAYLIHPPTVFNIFWKLVRPFIDPVTKEKVVFCTGKNGLQQFTDAVGPLFVHKLEEDCGGPGPVREFDSAEYMNLPFDVSFDEK